MAQVNPCHLTVGYLNSYAVGDVFVETGTYLGDGVLSALEYGKFKRIHSIELNEELANNAKIKFGSNPEVTIWHGDSVEELKNILTLEAGNRMTFFLDAHASGPLAGGKYGACPLVKELTMIGGGELREDNTSLVFSPGGIQKKFAPVGVAEKVDHTIFIDDQRLLGTAEWGYVRAEEIMAMLGWLGYSKFAFLDGHIADDLLVAFK